MNTENLQRKVLGIVAGILGVVVAMGWFTPEQATEVSSNVALVIQYGIGLVLGVVSIWKIATKGKTKEAEEE